jgi:hypothetical protein
MAQLANPTDASLDHPDRWVPRLQRMLDRQVALYTELDTLSRQQADLIDSGDTATLLAVLTSRQSLIDQITTANADLDPFVRSWPLLLAQITEAQRSDLEARFAGLDTLIGGIATRDDDDRRRLESRRKAASETISSANRARAAASAYAPAARGAAIPRYQDREA